MDEEDARDRDPKCEPIETPWSCLPKPNCNNLICIKKAIKYNLREVEEEICYHIDTGGDLKEGDRFSTKEKYNDYLNPRVLENSLSKNMDYDQVLQNLKIKLSANESLVEKYGKAADRQCDILNEYLDLSLKAFGNYIKLMRECVFEEVRGEFFSCLPSRLCCLWVIPDSDNLKESIQFWLSKLNEKVPADRRRDKIVKLELDGYLFNANEKFLPYSSLRPLSEVRKDAIKYWSGCSNEDSKNVECLFRGNFRVLKVFASIDDIK